MEATGVWVGLFGAILGAAGAAASILFGVDSFLRRRRLDIAQDASAMTALKVDIDYIKVGIDDIQADQHRMYEDFLALSERVIRVEESVKSAHLRVDEHLSTHRPQAAEKSCDAK